MPAAKAKKTPTPVRPVLTVGIGASAGGIDALHGLLGALPKDSGLSLIVNLHMDHDAGSLLAGTIRQFNSLPIVEVENGVTLSANTIYIIPGHHIASLKDSVFQLKPMDKQDPLRNPIDKFLSSLARDQGEKAAAVILAGNGNDGAIGLKEISKAGGLTLVQAPSTTKHEQMPQHAIDTGAVDHVLAPVNIAEELLAYAEHVQMLGKKNKFEELHTQVDKYLPEICDILLEAKGHNFKHYKASTLSRRIQRRIQVLKILSVAEYVKRLETDKAEIGRLFNDLLIGVTAFFRDPEAFEVLDNEVLAKLMKNRAADDVIRIWVPGCSTGEEAYTLAILLCEQVDKLEIKPEIQIFATDIDEESLGIARRGIYPHTITTEITPERLKKYFVKKAQHYHVNKEIRSLVLFSLHNLINDPPFSKLDMISCRNLLIYLGSHLQKKLIPLFHYALKSGGYLFLGPSENLSSHRELFKPVDAKNRISQRLSTAVHTSAILSGRNAPPTFVKPPNVASSNDSDTYMLMQRIVLDEFAPKSMVVDEEGQIICASGNLEKYVTVTAGTFQNNAMRMVKESLRIGLRTALAEATQHRRQITHEGLSLRLPEGIQRIMLTVQPMPQMGDESGLFLIVFHDVGLPLKEETTQRPPDEKTSLLIEQLERELHMTRESLEHTVQDLEAVNEEIKSSNEELLSMNEELQSANEELETSKEEVQAANDSLNMSNSDLENLLISTQIGTIFLNDNGQVLRALSPIGSIYNILPTDIGRSLSHFTHKAKFMPPLPTFDEICAAKKPFEHEIETLDGTWFTRRILPYRTYEGKISGIVVTFTEITERKRSELAVRKSEKALRLAVTSSRLGIWQWDPATDQVTLSERGAEIFGVPAGKPLARNYMIDTLIDEPFRQASREVMQHALDNRTDYSIEYKIIRPDGEFSWIQTVGAGDYDNNGTLLGLTGVVKDITDRKEAEESLKESEDRFRTMANSAPVLIWISNEAKERIWFNKPWFTFTGRTLDQEHGFGWSTNIHPEDVQHMLEAYNEACDARTTFRMEYRLKRHDGEYRWMLSNGKPMYNSNQQFTGYIGSAVDITDHKVATEALTDASQRKDEFLAMLAHELRNPLAPLSNSLQVLKMAGNSKPELLQQMQQVMERQVRHMVRLVDDLLDVSRITRGLIEIQKETLELQSVINNALEISRPLINSRNHTLTVSIPKGPMVVKGDMTRLSQVVSNLLNNAAKYTQDNGKIELKLVKKDDEAILTIKDNGIGIPKHMLSKIFDTFVQVDTALDRSEGGLGIGLTLVRTLVNLHGGSVEVKSDGASKGSEFTVKLKLTKAP